MGLMDKALRGGIRAMRNRATSELPPFSAVRMGAAVEPHIQQAQDWLMLAGSPERALQWADEELRYFRHMGDSQTTAKMEGAQAYLRTLVGSPTGSA